MRAASSIAVLALFLVVTAGALAVTTSTQEAVTTGGTQRMEKATFAAGCFWGVESAFRQLKGVKSAQVGYTGGTLPNPTYKSVCAGNTGHAEALEIEFDPSEISYEKLVEFFFRMHDPTTLNRQGPDIGLQYRSAIFYHSPEQKAVAEAVKEKVAKSGKYKNPIVTQILPAGPFYRAEEYHQRYFEKNGLPSCHVF